MRIISGKYKGRHLIVEINDKKNVKIKYRPTTDFLRETLFNILGEKIINASFVDIFAGCGSVGIEALSRGASDVSFIEINRNNVNVIKKNVKNINEKEKSNILFQDALGFLQNPDKKYDIVFIDPPYFEDYENKAVELAFKSEIINKNGIIILQHHKKISLDRIPKDSRRYGINVLSFFKYEK